METKTGWHIEDIKSEMAKKGHSQVSIARDLGVHKSSVCHILAFRQCKRYSPDLIERVTHRVAEIVGASREEIWPDQFGKRVEKHVVVGRVINGTLCTTPDQFGAA